MFCHNRSGIPSVYSNFTNQHEISSILRPTITDFRSAFIQYDAKLGSTQPQLVLFIESNSIATILCVRSSLLGVRWAKQLKGPNY